MTSTPGLLYGAKESVVHYTLLKVTTLIDSLKSGRLARRAATGTANSCVTSELGKCVV
jgi:hypothetical protein